MKATALLVVLALAGGPAMAQPAPPSQPAPPAQPSQAPQGPAVDAPGKLPDPAATLASAAYDSRLLSSFAAAERFQGGLDGGWTLSAEDQGDVYGFQFTDGHKGLEGAWRDLRRKGVPGASGFVDEVRRDSGAVVVRFLPFPAEPAVVTLHPDGAVLRGDLDQNGRRTPVVLRKAGP